MMSYGDPAAGPMRLNQLTDRWINQDVQNAYDQHSIKVRNEKKGVFENQDAAEIDQEKPNYLAPVFLTMGNLGLPLLAQQMRTRARSSFKLKLLPDVRRIAAIADNEVLIWDYDSGGDPTAYEANAVVSDIGCVVAPEEVFMPHITHLIVVATWTGIEIVPVEANDASLSRLRLHPLRDHIVTHRNSPMRHVVGFKKGRRVFLGGSDGCAYELTMSARKGWLRNQFHLTNISLPFGDYPGIGRLQYAVRDYVGAFSSNGCIADMQVDEDRFLLSTLDTAGNIRVWWLGSCEADKKASAVGGHLVPNAVCMFVVPRQTATKTQPRNDDILRVLTSDGRRLTVRGTFEESRLESMSTVTTSGGALSGRSMKDVLSSVQGGKTLVAGGLQPPQMEGMPDGVVSSNETEAPARHYVGPNSSLMVPSPCPDVAQLIGTAPLSLDGTANCVGVVDLSPIYRTELQRARASGQHVLASMGKLEVSGVTEEQWMGDLCGLVVSQHDLCSQILRPQPRLLVSHSLGLTSVVRVRAIDLVHLALHHQGGGVRWSGIQAKDVETCDLRWLRSTYGPWELGVMLLALIAKGQVPAMPAGVSVNASSDEQRCAQMLAEAPSPTVVQRAKAEMSSLLRDAGPGYASLFCFFGRCIKPLWGMKLGSDTLQKLWTWRMLGSFQQLLEGFQGYLDEVRRIRLDRADLDKYWNADTDELYSDSAPTPDGRVDHDVSRKRTLLQQYFWDFPTYFDLSVAFVAARAEGGAAQTNAIPPDVLILMQGLALVKLCEVVANACETVKVLHALSFLEPADRLKVSEQLKPFTFSDVVVQRLERDKCAAVLVKSLLQRPAGSELVWSAWNKCQRFFDPADQPFYEARRYIVSERQGDPVGHPLVAAMREMRRPDVASRMLNIPPPVEMHLLTDKMLPAEGTVPRINMLCEELRAAHKYRDAIEHAAVAAQSADQEQLAEEYHTIHIMRPGGVFLHRSESDMIAAPYRFNGRAKAYDEIVRTLEEVLDTASSAKAADAGFAAREVDWTQKVGCVHWAFGEAAARFFDQPAAQQLQRPLLEGALFGSSDVLLHFALYNWLSQRPGSGPWPSRQDLQHVRPYRAPGRGLSQEPDSLEQWLLAGRSAHVADNPMHQANWTLHPNWVRTWKAWHVGLVKDLALYCEARGRHSAGVQALLGLAHAPHALLKSSPDVAAIEAAGGSILNYRQNQLRRAEEMSRRDVSSDVSKKINSYLEKEKFSAVAGIQLELARRLPEEMRELKNDPVAQPWMERDREQLEQQLLSHTELFTILHDSYDSIFPDIALKLLCLKGISGPEKLELQLQQHPLRLCDFISRVTHNYLARCNSLETVRDCFRALCSAAGLQPGAQVHQAFFPVEVVLSGLEEMALSLEPGAADVMVPDGTLVGPGAQSVSPVPEILGEVLIWADVYNGYRRLLGLLEKVQPLRDNHTPLSPHFRGLDPKLNKAVRIRVVAVLIQLILQKMSDLSGRSEALSRERDSQKQMEYISDDLQRVIVPFIVQEAASIPESVRLAAEICQQRLQQM
eukprot:TRINITY_DN1334_c0_g1_i1.p1 TRINITY_DN1334_c0_g1~~TRINITY_DN1334_c0_g1_i1.p1  ORF type:complete len:1535 (+),score=523.16 TRINITY_DN1334_c0_g1_i1:156-4760(+)